MKYHCTALLLLLFFAGLSGKAQEGDNVFVKVEIVPHTDPRQWAAYIKQGTQLHDSITQAIPAGQYKVTVQYVINVHGTMGQYKLLDDPGFGLGQRGLQLVKQYPGRWTPASQCGRNVAAYRKEVIVYDIKKPVVESNNR